MKRDDRDAEVEDMADRVRIMADNFAQDLHQNQGLDREYAFKLAWVGIRRAAREGPERH